MADTSALLATWLDHERLTRRGVHIAPAGLTIEQLPLRTGREVFSELGGGLLVKYILSDDIGRFRNGHPGRHWLTPTAYSPTEAVVWLALPSPNRPRGYALLLDPREIPVIYGPQWVAQPGGIQYVILNGFPRSAIVVPGAPGAAWETVVR
jgi:hypothetical protein